MKIALILLATAVAMPAAVQAQSASSGDVVVMRRQLVPAKLEDAPSKNGGTWRVGDPVVTPGCSASSPSQAPVTCVDAGGTAVADTKCGATPRPDGRGTAPSYATCSYRWITGVYSTPSPTCSDSAYRTRTVACQRQDPALTEVAASFCDPTSPDAQTRDGPLGYHAGCSYAPTYSATYGACVNKSQSAPITSCRRSDGVDVAVAECGADRQTTSRACASTKSSCGEFEEGKYVTSIDTGVVDGSYFNLGTITGATKAARQAAAKDLCEKTVFSGYHGGVLACSLADGGDQSANGTVLAAYGVNRAGIGYGTGAVVYSTAQCTPN